MVSPGKLVRSKSLLWLVSALALLAVAQTACDDQVEVANGLEAKVRSPLRSTWTRATR